MTQQTDYQKMTTGKKGGFTWGKLIATHEIANIKIVEYIDVNGTSFHPFIDEKDTGHSYSTLKQAIVGAIADEAEGPNNQACQYFFRMIGQEI